MPWCARATHPPHPLYLGLGANDTERQQAYRELFKAKLHLNDLDDLRAHTRQQKAWGSDRFRQQVEALAQRSAGIRPRGRPRSSDK